MVLVGVLHTRTSPCAGVRPVGNFKSKICAGKNFEFDALTLIESYSCPTNVRIAPCASNKEKKGQHTRRWLITPHAYVSHFPRGADLAPLGHQGRNRGLANETIPKSVLRVLDAAKIRAEYRQKCKLLEADANGDDGPTSKKRRTTRPAATGGDTSMNAKGSKGKGKESKEEKAMIKTQPGESLRAFNRCVFSHSFILLSPERGKYTPSYDSSFF
jgi:hypothetical protein